MRLILQLSVIIILLTGLSSNAQETDSLSAQYIVAFHPFHIIQQGIKLEVERRAFGNRFSFSISPEFYNGVIDNAKDKFITSANRDTVEVFGFGISATARLYIHNRFLRKDFYDPVSNFYLFGSMEFRSFGLDYTGRVWTLETSNGIDTYRLRSVPQHNNIIRLDANMGIGNTIFLGDNFIIDGFIYLRVSKSFQNPSTVENIPYSDSFFTKVGNSLGFGFRFGLLLE